MVARMTIPTRLVLEAMLTEPAGEHFGRQLGQVAGLPSGTVHPILARLEASDWVASRWEDVDPGEEGRPRRRYYRLTPEGQAQAEAAMARRARPAALRAVSQS